MRVRLVVVGRDRHDPLVDAADAYLARVHRFLPVEVIELKEAPLRRSAAPEQVMKAEAERIERALPSTDRVIALDRKGRAVSSEQLAQSLGQARDEGARGWSLVIGGPSGLHPSLLARADESWSLSALTLPHRLARLVISEQLYRACSILRGAPYHK